MFQDHREWKIRRKWSQTSLCPQASRYTVKRTSYFILDFLNDPKRAMIYLCWGIYHLPQPTWTSSSIFPVTFFFFFLGIPFIFIIYLFIYLWLCWVFVSVLGPSLVAASGGHSSSRCAGLSPSRPLLLRSTGSRCAGSVGVAHGPSCSAARGIFPDQGSNPCPLHWQEDSQPLRHQGSPSQLLLVMSWLLY